MTDKLTAIYAVIEKVANQKVLPNDRLDGVGIDSLAVVALQIELEDAFKITMPDGEWADWKRVADVAKSVEKHLT